MYPIEAYGIHKLKLLLHHTDKVKNADDNETVDLQLLKKSFFELSTLEGITPEVKAEARSHLIKHINQNQNGVCEFNTNKDLIIDLHDIKFNDGVSYKIFTVLHVIDAFHQLYGPIKITKQNLESIEKNFHLKVRGIDLAVDFGHKSWDEAAGWYLDMWLNEDHSALLASVSFTPLGAGKLADKSFRYFSPEFTLNYIDKEGNEHGPTMLGGALTNRPFLNDLEALVTLSESNKPKTKPKESNKMDFEIKFNEALKQIESLKKQLSDNVSNIKLQESETKVKTLTEEVKTLKDENTKMQNAIDLSEKKSKFSELLNAGKVVKAQEKAFMKLPLADAVEFAESQGNVTNLKGHGGNGDNNIMGDFKLSEKEEEQIKKLKISKKDYIEINYPVEFEKIWPAKE